MSGGVPMHGASPPLTMPEYPDLNFFGTSGIGADDIFALDPFSITSSMS
jgi:hypothetical protein